jgi:hypothetical protein
MKRGVVYADLARRGMATRWRTTLPTFADRLRVRREIHGDR